MGAGTIKSEKETPPMPLSNLLESASGTYPVCNQKASILSREHPDCRPDLARLQRPSKWLLMTG